MSNVDNYLPDTEVYQLFTFCFYCLLSLTFSRSVRLLFPIEKTCKSVSLSMFSILEIRLLYKVRSCNRVSLSSPSIISMLLKDKSEIIDQRLQYFKNNCNKIHFWNKGFCFSICRQKLRNGILSSIFYLEKRRNKSILIKFVIFIF